MRSDYCDQDGDVLVDMNSFLLELAEHFKGKLPALTARATKLSQRFSTASFRLDDKRSAARLAGGEPGPYPELVICRAKDGCMRIASMRRGERELMLPIHGSPMRGAERASDTMLSGEVARRYQRSGDTQEFFGMRLAVFREL